MSVANLLFGSFLHPHARFKHTQQFLGELAQLGERLVCNQEVTGSSPVFSTSLRSQTPGLNEARRSELRLGRPVELGEAVSPKLTRRLAQADAQREFWREARRASGARRGWQR